MTDISIPYRAWRQHEIKKEESDIHETKLKLVRVEERTPSLDYYNFKYASMNYLVIMGECVYRKQRHEKLTMSRQFPINQLKFKCSIVKMGFPVFCVFPWGASDYDSDFTLYNMHVTCAMIGYICT